ncbi:DUF2182 domain-containing protein [Dyella silvatica]|uniref:DUF2182 domain-containing protein n=1 Tax=Dyella silvatica TaxID=2992128 RepID=UPI00225750E8|nr:DUF2182 domain-containing protein [Dyella silvatica]
MPGQTWLGSAAAFLGMWVVMMVAMMLPSVLPRWWRYRLAMAAAGTARLARLTALLGAGYFFVWAVWGVAVFALGSALSAMAMQQPALARAVPSAAAIVMLIAGVLQFTAWKAHQLACCREAPSHDDYQWPADTIAAWRDGLRHGLRCSYCCGGLTVVLLVIGAMDLRAMAIVAAAITAERLAPAGDRVARLIGAVIVGAGLARLALAAGLA